MILLIPLIGAIIAWIGDCIQPSRVVEFGELHETVYSSYDWLWLKIIGGVICTSSIILIFANAIIYGE